MPAADNSFCMSYSLFLYPDAGSSCSIKKPELENFLIQHQFCASIENQENAVTLTGGRQLMDYITFLGCSPALESGGTASTISLHAFERVCGLGGESIQTIRFPGCKHPISDPATLLSDHSPDDHWQCPDCGQQGTMHSINWRKTAGFAKIFIEVTPIFPGEAIPSDKLLNLLHSISGARLELVLFEKQAPRTCCKIITL